MEARHVSKLIAAGHVASGENPFVAAAQASVEFYSCC
jgi:hypothetical protein